MDVLSAGMDSDASRTRRGFLAAMAGTTAALAGCSTGYADSANRNDGAPTDSASADVPEPSGDVRYTETYREVAPSVTTVRVSGASGLGQGSGAVVDDGHVVTNQHVVAGADEASVVYTDGSYADAEIQGTDVHSDLAVLRVDHPNDPPALEFATEDPPVGREVIVVGTPFGVGESVTSGIVSGVDRSLPGPQGFPIPDTVQTDAAANPGNSGGPLVALDGTPLGLVNAAAGNDITFAISGALMARVVPALIEDSEFEHTFVGIGIRELSPASARANVMSLPSAASTSTRCSTTRRPRASSRGATGRPARVAGGCPPAATSSWRSTGRGCAARASSAPTSRCRRHRATR
jgi:S1-C subfamily serine protease